MRLSLWNEPQISAIPNGGAALVQTLKQITASIRAGWNKQHDSDGAHTDVTADSVTAPLIRSQGRLVGSRSGDCNNPPTATTSPLIPGSGRFNTSIPGNTFFDILRVRTNTAGVDPTVIHGIDATGREEGERIIIVNSGNGSLTLKLPGGTTAPTGTQFIIDSNLTPAVFAELTLGPAGWVEAVYLHHVFFNKNYWHLTSVRET